MLNKLYWLIALCAISTMAVGNTAPPTVVCAYDPTGEQGTVAKFAQSIVAGYQQQNVNAQLEVYRSDLLIGKKYQQGSCDAILVLGFMARPYNTFSTTVEAFGAIRNREQINRVLSLLSQDDLADKFIQNEHEIAGIYPLGLAHLVSTNTRTENLEALKGKRFFTNRKEPALGLFSQKLGMSKVHGNSQNFIMRIQRGEVDFALLPVLVPQTLGLTTDIAKTGQILDLPLRLLTLQMVINSDRFPAGFGIQARKASLAYAQGLLKKVYAIEEQLKPLMSPVSDADQEQWLSRLKDIRNEMIELGHYDAAMLTLIKQ